MRKFVIMTLALSSVAVAQKTIVVDATGQGGHKTIQGAIDVARDGDRIVVLPGSYTAFTVDDKALTIFGSKQSYVYTLFANASTRVRRLTAGKRVVIDSLVFWTGAQAAVVVEDCKGRVTLRGVDLFGSVVIFGNGNRGSLSVSNSDAVLVQDASLSPGILASGSSIALVGSKIYGHSSNAGHYFVPATPGVIAHGSVLDIAASVVVGGLGAANFASRAALEVGGTRVVLRDTSAITGRPAAIATAASSLELGAGAKVSGEVKGFTTVKKRSLPSMTTTAAIRGLRYEVRAHGKKGDFFASFVAAPSTPLTLAAFGDLWLDAKTLVLLGAGSIDASGSHALHVLAGIDAKWFGLELDFQALVGTPNDLRLTNVASVVYR